MRGNQQIPNLITAVFVQITVRLQTNHANLLLRLKNELKTIFILELLLVIKMIEERTTALNDK